MKRYDCYYLNDFGDDYSAQSRVADDGDWVRFEDHQAEVARIQALESEFHNIDDVAEIRRLQGERASAIDRLTPLGLENGRLKQRCWALALLLYPSGEVREAIEGDI